MVASLEESFSNFTDKRNPFQFLALVYPEYVEGWAISKNMPQNFAYKSLGGGYTESTNLSAEYDSQGRVISVKVTSTDSTGDVDTGTISFKY
ncbi:MAG: hypothetical protein ACLFUB_17525 [Cyclobacteriaceae bacterium]